MSKLNQLNGATENYTYDPIYQVTQVQQVLSGNTNTTETYTYDAVGNRLSSLNASYSYNNSNELTSSSDGYSYTYDANGNMLSTSNTTGTTSYAWDFENRLTTVTLPSGGGAVSFKYDPFGRRIQKAVASGITNYLYEGDNSIEELDGTGALLARYAQLNSIDEPLSMLRGSAIAFFEADGLNSVTSLTSQPGRLEQTYTFGSFGNKAASSGSLTNPYQYTGRDSDIATGLYYYRARYYSPTIGRFTSEDPLGFESDPNFYRYGSNESDTLIPSVNA
jgi:RHS repeat-associated protein